jgi:hypothetical protein
MALFLIHFNIDINKEKRTAGTGCVTSYLRSCTESWSGVQPLEERACSVIGIALTDTAVQWLMS